MTNFIWGTALRLAFGPFGRGMRSPDTMRCAVGQGGQAATRSAARAAARFQHGAGKHSSDGCGCQAGCWRLAGRRSHDAQFPG